MFVKQVQTRLHSLLKLRSAQSYTGERKHQKDCRKGQGKATRWKGFHLWEFDSLWGECFTVSQFRAARAGAASQTSRSCCTTPPRPGRGTRELQAVQVQSSTPQPMVKGYCRRPAGKLKRWAGPHGEAATRWVRGQRVRDRLPRTRRGAPSWTRRLLRAGRAGTPSRCRAVEWRLEATGDETGRAASPESPAAGTPGLGRSGRSSVVVTGPGDAR